MATHFGDVPTWIAAVGSLVAVGGAIYAGLKTKEMLTVEQDRDKDSREREIKSQANQIAGWVFPDPEEAGANAYTPLFKMRVSAIVSNPSLQPIYNVVVLWRLGTQSLLTNNINLIAPEDVHTWELSEEFYNYLELNYLLSWSGSKEEAYKRSEDASRLLKLIFSFTDTRGKRWQRDDHGFLTEVKIVSDTGSTFEPQRDENE